MSPLFRLTSPDDAPREDLSLTEWGAWCALAMMFDGRLCVSGVCAAITYELPWPNYLQAQMASRARANMPKTVRGVGGYWWMFGAYQPRARFCWKMAEQCEREESE